MFKTISGKILETKRTNYGKLIALPFFLSAWTIGTASGIMDVIRNTQSIGTMLEMAGIGIALYTSSKGIDRYYDYKTNATGDEPHEHELSPEDPLEESTPPPS
jgi:hypothetical protein